MGATVQWLIPDKVIFIHLDGDIGAADLQFIADKIDTHIKETTAEKVHVLSDELNAKRNKRDLREGISSLSWVRDPKIGWVVACESTAQYARTKILGRLTVSLLNIQYRKFGTVDDAIKFLVGRGKDMPSIQEMKDAYDTLLDKQTQDRK